MAIVDVCDILFNSVIIVVVVVVVVIVLVLVTHDNAVFSLIFTWLPGSVRLLARVERLW